MDVTAGKKDRRLLNKRKWESFSVTKVIDVKIITEVLQLFKHVMVLLCVRVFSEVVIKGSIAGQLMTASMTTGQDFYT